MPTEYTITPQRPGLYELRQGASYAVRAPGARWPFSFPRDLATQHPPAPRVWITDDHFPEYHARWLELLDAGDMREAFQFLRGEYFRCRLEDVPENCREAARAYVKANSQRLLAVLDQQSWDVCETFPPNQTTTRTISP